MDPPRPPATIAGIAASTVFQAPIRLTSTTSRNVCRRSSLSVTRMIPALAMTMSRPPNSSTPSATTASRAAGSRNISLARQDPATLVLDQRDGFRQVVGGRAGIVGGVELRAGVDGDDVGAFAGQLDGVCPPHSTGDTGDEGDASVFSKSPQPW